MTHPDHGPSFADDFSADSESVYRVYLTTDVRPAIRAATADQMRGILAAIARHLCHHLTDPIGGIPPLSPDSRAPWQVCQAGTGTRVGLQLYSRVLQAVAGSYLQALGFDPDRATQDTSFFTTSIDPFLRHTRKQQLGRALLHIADYLETIVHDSDTAADASAQADLPEDVWEVATGVGAAVELYRHGVRVLAVHVLFYLWDGLGIGDQPRVFRQFADRDFLAIPPN